MDRMVLSGCRVVVGTGSVIEKASIVTENGVVAAIAVGSDEPGTIDLAGKTVMPGLLDAHVHILLGGRVDGTTPTLRQLVQFGAEAGEGELLLELLQAPRRALAYLAAGVTTIRDLGGATGPVVALREAVEGGLLIGPRMMVAGRIITMTGGISGRRSLVASADGVDEVRKVVREQLAAGVDVVKLYASRGILGPLAPGEPPGGPTMTEEEIGVAVLEAHRAGKRVSAHAQSAEAVKAAVRAGADTVEHGALLDEEAVGLMAERGTYYVPTLESVANVVRLGSRSDFPSYYIDNAKRIMDRHRQGFALARIAGVRIVAGTDAGAEGAPDHGDLAAELEAMVHLGMSPMEALTSATATAAEALGRADLGTVELGRLADLVVLNRNPLDDIGALRDVHLVIKGGRPFSPQALSRAPLGFSTRPEIR